MKNCILKNPKTFIVTKIMILLMFLTFKDIEDLTRVVISYEIY